MQLNLNDKLDAAALGLEYQRRGFIQVKEVLPGAEAGERFSIAGWFRDSMR